MYKQPTYTEAPVLLLPASIIGNEISAEVLTRLTMRVKSVGNSTGNVSGISPLINPFPAEELHI